MLQRDMEEELGDGQPMFLGTWNDRGRIADADLLDKQRYVRRVRRNTWSRSAPPPRAPLSPLLRSSPLGSVGGGCGRGVWEERWRGNGRSLFARSSASSASCASCSDLCSVVCGTWCSFLEMYRSFVERGGRHMAVQTRRWC